MGLITFLGTGCGMPAAQRFQASVLLRDGGDNILLDAGEPCAQRLREMGIYCRDVDSVFLSHGHADHVAGLPLLIQANAAEKRTKPLKVHSPAALLDPLVGWLKAIHLFPDELGFPLELHALQPGRTITGQGWELQPFATTHLCHRGAEAFGFAVTLDNCRVVYSGDLGGADDLKQPLQPDTSVLITELSHLTPEELADVLHNTPLDLLCLVHLGPDQFDAREATGSFLSSRLPKVDEILFPRDGEHFEI